MFRNTATADIEPAHEFGSGSEPVPLSVLALDLEPPSTGGWEHHLLSRGVVILVDDIGRPAISRADARRLFSEKHENEVRLRKQREAVEAQAVEADKQWRASLYRGVPWYQVPDGVTPSAAMLQAAKDDSPRRRSLVEDFLGRDEVAFHSLQGEEAS